MKIAYIDADKSGKIKIYDKNGKMKALLDSPSDGVLKGFGSEFFVMETPESSALPSSGLVFIFLLPLSSQFSTKWPQVHSWGREQGSDDLVKVEGGG